MPSAKINGVSIYFEETGAGEPLVLVHGSWGDHHNWDAVVPALAKRFHVVAYDRRGHSRSDRPAGQGTLAEDAADLAALIEHLGIGPAHVAGNSAGAIVTLRLAAQRPDLFRTMIVHEPPLFPLLASKPGMAPVLEDVGRRITAVVERLERGDHEDAARQFVETIAFGPGAWNQLPDETRRTFTFNAPTFLDETREPGGLSLELATLRGFPQRALVSHGTTSAPFFPLVVEDVAQALPRAQRFVFSGAGHVPHITHPDAYVECVTGFARDSAS